MEPDTEWAVIGIINNQEVFLERIIDMLPEMAYQHIHSLMEEFPSHFDKIKAIPAEMRFSTIEITKHRSVNKNEN